MDDESKIDEMKKQMTWKNITIICLLVTVLVFILREVLTR
jgi:hypothetical protein